MAWADSAVDHGLSDIHALSRVMRSTAPLKVLREMGIIPSRQRRFIPESLLVVTELDQSSKKRELGGAQAPFAIWEYRT